MLLSDEPAAGAELQLHPQLLQIVHGHAVLMLLFEVEVAQPVGLFVEGCQFWGRIFEDVSQNIFDFNHIFPVMFGKLQLEFLEWGLADTLDNSVPEGSAGELKQGPVILCHHLILAHDK